MVNQTLRKILLPVIIIFALTTIGLVRDASESKTGGNESIEVTQKSNYDLITAFVDNLKTDDVNNLPAPGSPNRMSPDLKSNINDINNIYDNYGRDENEKFSNFIKDLIFYSNDLLDVNRLQRNPEHYMMLAKKYNSKNFSYIYINSESKDQNQLFTVSARYGDSIICNIKFKYIYSKITDETEDYFTRFAALDHTQFYPASCVTKDSITGAKN